MKLLVLLLLYAPTSFASELRLDRTNHSGYRMVDVLAFENGDYFFNGKNLGKKLPPQILKSWTDFEAETSRRTPSQSCASGTYVFVKKDQRREHHQNGCTEGEAYGRVIKNLEEIRNFAKDVEAP